MLNLINKITHNELVEYIFSVYKEADKQKYTNLFLASLSLRKLEWRSGLPVFAIMQSFPYHKFSVSENRQKSQKHCLICSDYEYIMNENEDVEFIKESFIECGGIIDFSLLNYYYYMFKTNSIEDVIPKEKDLIIFSDILDLILSSKDKDLNKKQLLSRMSEIKIFSSNIEERKLLLETLGYCSILQTDKYKGLLHQYTNLAIAPHKTHSSDWEYPIDFWTGKDGINKEAFKFWFGNYTELERFWK